MNPQETAPSSDRHPIRNPLSVMQPGEQTVCEIKRHPMGMFVMYGIVGLFLVVLAVIAFIVAPAIFGGSDPSQVTAVGAVFFVLLTAVALVFVFITNKVYWGNCWIVTSDSITQITQTGLFDRQSSQLSLGNLEDVTAEQNGVFPRMFHYGVIRAETAGERSKFMFIYCPTPNYYAQQILNAREKFEQSRRVDNPQRLYDPAADYQQPSSPTDNYQTPPSPPQSPQPPQEATYNQYGQVPPPPLSQDYPPQQPPAPEANISTEPPPQQYTN